MLLGPASLADESPPLGASPENPLRIPEDFRDTDRFLVMMAAKTLLTPEEEIRKSIPDDLARMAFLGNHLLKTQEAKIIQQLDPREEPENEFEARRRGEPKLDPAWIEPVRNVKYIAYDISNLIEDVEYDFEEKGFEINKNQHEVRLITMTDVRSRLPSWMGNIHPFETFIPLAEDLAEKWKSEGGRLVGVYQVEFASYTGANSSVPYNLSLNIIKYQFVSPTSGVITEIADDKTRLGKAFYNYKDEPPAYGREDQGWQPFWIWIAVLFCIATVLAIAGIGWWILRKKKQDSGGTPPPLRPFQATPPALGGPPPPLPPDDNK